MANPGIIRPSLTNPPSQSDEPKVDMGNSDTQQKIEHEHQKNYGAYKAFKDSGSGKTVTPVGY